MKITIRGIRVKSKLISKSLSNTEIDMYKPTWLVSYIFFCLVHYEQDVGCVTCDICTLWHMLVNSVQYFGCACPQFYMYYFFFLLPSPLLLLLLLYETGIWVSKLACVQGYVLSTHVRSLGRQFTDSQTPTV